MESRPIGPGSGSRPHACGGVLQPCSAWFAPGPSSCTHLAWEFPWSPPRPTQPQILHVWAGASTQPDIVHPQSMMGVAAYLNLDFTSPGSHAKPSPVQPTPCPGSHPCPGSVLTHSAALPGLAHQILLLCSPTGAVA